MVYPVTPVSSSDAAQTRSTAAADVDVDPRSTGCVGGPVSLAVTSAITSSNATLYVRFFALSPSCSRPIGVVPRESILRICGIAGSSSATSMWLALPSTRTWTTRWCQVDPDGISFDAVALPTTSLRTASFPALLMRTVRRFVPVAVCSLSRTTDVDRLSKSNRVPYVTSALGDDNWVYAYAFLPGPVARAAHAPENTASCCGTRPTFAVQLVRSPLSKPSENAVNAREGVAETKGRRATTARQKQMYRIACTTPMITR